MAADTLSELLIAQLLEEDMRFLESQREADELQLTQALADSAKGQGRIPKRAAREPTPDFEHAIRLMAEEARFSGDAAFAQSLQHSDDAEATANRQYAMKLAATEKKGMLDAEFARRLQEADDDVDLDDPNMKDAESVLGQDAIDRILASDPNHKGKGKHKGHDVPDAEARQLKRVKKEEETVHIKQEFHSNTANPICGICLEPFCATYSPVTASRSANSSARLPFGLYLPCPQSHPYCLTCLCTYIKTKLDPNGDGSGSPNAVVFPIPCPGCTVVQWATGIQDAVAARLLTEKEMALWHQQRLLDSLPRVYCPNPKCSALVQVHDDEDEPQAQCPACTHLICVPCRVLWHENMTCEDYQALPLDERSPEDQQALQLAKAQNWRRCPNCAVIVELTMGCNHITCRCGTHFCFKCGSLWDIRNTRCTREPSCDLWDEAMLLEERERNREAQVNARAVRAAPPPPYVERNLVHLPQVLLRPPVAAPEVRLLPPQAAEARGELEWMNNREFLCTKHFFTANMISNLTCLYCDAKLTSLADLRYHLSHTRRHDVYACCGRFFKREEDFMKHTAAEPRKWGRHVHQVRRLLL